MHGDDLLTILNDEIDGECFDELLDECLEEELLLICDDNPLILK